MRRDLLVKTRSLGGSSDLTLIAPITPGLVPSLESVTYKTRLKRLLATLNAGRTASHEYSLLRVFTDAVERVGKIHSVRVAIVEPDRVLLSVTFDGGWESYLRVLWQKVGTLLDLIFCNAVGYVAACGEDGNGGRFEDWAEWIRGVQIETDFFYGMPAHTADDVQYLRNEERAHRQIPGDPPPDLAATRQTIRSAEEMTWSLHLPYPRPYIIKDLGRQGVRALVLLHRLTAYYLPETADGRILHRAAHELLQEFILLYERNALEQVITEARKRFDEQVTWLLRAVEPREVPALPDVKPEPEPREDVQFGIISAYPPGLSHGCLVLIAFRSRGGAAEFLGAMDEVITRETADPRSTTSFVNLSLTFEGLRALGLSEHQLALFPQEFREGMEARASVLGDYRTNHPRRWRLPTRNFPEQTSQLVELSSVHAIVQVRLATDPRLRSLGNTLDEVDPLRQVVSHLRDEWLEEIDVLAVQPMVRHLNEAGRIREHFGFADGDSQPVLDPADNGNVYDRNQVQLGEFLLGYPNEAEGPADPPERGEWLHNGSFLVVRKLSQDVKALDDAVSAAADATSLTKELVYAKLMGRWRNGDPAVPLLAHSKNINDFDFGGEMPPGSQCPFHAHIRRANPRQSDNPLLPPVPPGRRTARLMRRGMSYGPVFDPERADADGSERGLIFMAYNTSIAEQFEVVQRWITGGNSSGGFSGQGDPLLGVATIGQKKYFRFEHEGTIHRIELDGSTRPLEDPRPFVRLEWGLYLFTPSLKALDKLARTAAERDGQAEEEVWSADDGEKRIAQLLARYPEQELKDEEFGEERRKEAVAAWKALLEDPEAQRKFESASAWAAIRRRGGVLRTPYGVIVATRKLVADVLKDRNAYSVSGYHERMKDTIGEIFLGLDDTAPGCPYHQQSEATNKAIGALTKEEAFSIVRAATSDAINALIKNEISIAEEYGEPTWELSLDVKEVVDSALAALCQAWFGLPKEGHPLIQPGGARWDWQAGQPVRYPGHFTAPSRYFFQPHPSETVQKYGSDYGKSLAEKFGEAVKQHRDKVPVFNPPDAPLTKAILDAFPSRQQDQLAGRTMAGALMGFLPTLDGNIRLSLNEWLRDGTFWSLRNQLSQLPAGQELKNAENLLWAPLGRTMQLRPSPELIWRTPTREGLAIGTESVGAGDRIVLSIVSATQECLEAARIDPDPDVYPIFGEKRIGDHPTHACPGYNAAIGALLGFMSALMEVKDSMRPGGAPLALTLEGVMPKRTKTVVEESWWDEVKDWFIEVWSGTDRAPTKPLLVADGDSWMSYAPWGPLGEDQNIAAYLATNHGFEVRNISSPGTRLYSFFHNGTDSGADTWTPVQKNEASSDRLERLVKTVKDLVRQGKPPSAILFSAGGTDVVEERLLRLLSVNAQPGAELNGAKVDQHVDAWMADWLEKVLRVINETCRVQNVPIPVFLHGYDYPVPDARALRGVSLDRSWLWTHFHKRKYEQDTSPVYPARCTPVMRTLIERLNTMQRRVAAKFPGHVFHVTLTGILSSAQGTYTRDWDNELHPSPTGFTVLTRKFAEEITAHALHGGS